MAGNMATSLPTMSMGAFPTYQAAGASTYQAAPATYTTMPAYQAAGATTMAAPTQYLSSAARPMTMAQPTYTRPTSTYAQPQIMSSGFQAAPATTMMAPASTMLPQSMPVQSFAAPRTIAATPQYVTTAAAAPQYVTTAPMTTMMPSVNLLAAGNVISERVIPYEEMIASGVLRVEGTTVPVIETVTEQFIGQDGRVYEEQVLVQENILVEAAPQEAVGGPIEGLLNQAFVFIKPHAFTELTINTTRDMLANFGITVTAEGDITSDIIDERKLIDQHYYAIASKATILKPDQLNVDDAKFQGVFGIPWADALPTAYNAMDAMAALESNVEELNELWGQCKTNNKLVKLGGGFYCGLVEKSGYQPIYVFNAFFMNMRNEYVAPGNCIHWFVVEWDERALSWADFRGQVLGPTDPATAPENSIRGMILQNWQQLGLAQEPNTGLNGVHASASPLEGLYERMNWLGVPTVEDPFGNYLLQLGVPQEFIDAYSTDPQANLPEEKVGSVWDHLEDCDASTTVDKFVAVVNLNMEQ